MKNQLIRNRFIWFVGAFIALCASWVLCRFTFFDLHGNKQWVMLLFIIGLVVLIISAIKDARKVMGCTIVGYIGGFALGIVFGVDVPVDVANTNSGTTNNWWFIWTISYLVIIIIGVIWEVLAKRIKSGKVRK